MLTLESGRLRGESERNKKKEVKLTSDTLHFSLNRNRISMTSNTVGSIVCTLQC